MIELLACLVAFTVLIAGLGIGILTRRTPLNRTCSSVHFLTNTSCLTGCDGAHPEAHND